MVIEIMGGDLQAYALCKIINNLGCLPEMITYSDCTLLHFIISKIKLGKDCDNLITVDFICHRVPVPKAWRTYLEFRETVVTANVEHTFFRNKKTDGKSIF